MNEAPGLFPLAGKVAAITGAASGIGKALAERFAAEGMKLVLVDIELSALDAVCRDLATAGVPVRSRKVDVSRVDDVEAMAQLAFDSFGRVDILCNNAGIVPAGRFRPVWEYPVEDWRWALDVNLMGAVHGMRSFVPRMLAQGGRSHIVNTASVAGFVSGSGSVPYGAAKHAVVRASEALYASLREMGAPIGVTILCPGLVRTRIYDSERSRPQDLRPAAGPAPEAQALQAAAPALYANALGPEAVAEIALKAIRDNQLYAFTTTAFDDAIGHRAASILARANPDFDDLLAMTQRDSRRRDKS